MSDVVEPKCFTWESLSELTAALEEVQDADQFLQEADRLLTHPGSSLPLPFATGGLPNLSTNGTRHTHEFENAKALYTSLGAMPLVAGSDARLWTWLALGPYRDYMMARWPLHGTRNWRGRVTDRWILKSGATTSGRLIRHGVARLWWLAELTHQATTSSDDPRDEWHYLSVALSNEDIVLNVFDRDAGSVPALRFALLDQAAGWGQGGAEKTKSLMKEVTLSFGYRDLTTLSAGDAQDLVTGLARVNE